MKACQSYEGQSERERKIEKGRSEAKDAIAERE